MRIVIDTNVVLDALMKREPWSDMAEQIILAAAAERVVGCITASTITDVYYLLRKHQSSREQRKQTLLALMAVVEVLDVTSADCENAFSAAMPDFEDALLSCCAARHNADYIVTRNLKDFAASAVPPISPGEFLERCLTV
jgi:predicted nucleic acid-binding protein